MKRKSTENRRTVTKTVTEHNRAESRINLGDGYWSRVSPEDFEEAAQIRWRPQLQGDNYVGTRGQVDGQTISLGRFVLKRFLQTTPPEDLPEEYLFIDANFLFVDHINGDPLDNRRENLRFATHRLNARNRRPNQGKRFKGVYKYRERFYARIRIDGHEYRSGLVATELEAAKEYNKLALRFHKKFARLNKVD